MVCQVKCDEKIKVVGDLRREITFDAKLLLLDGQENDNVPYHTTMEHIELTNFESKVAFGSRRNHRRPNYHHRELRICQPLRLKAPFWHDRGPNKNIYRNVDRGSILMATLEMASWRRSRNLCCCFL
jgi:hypothetical protein